VYACACARTSSCVRLSNRQSVRTISTLKHLLSDRVALPTIGDGYHLRFQIVVVSSSRKNCNNIPADRFFLLLLLCLSLTRARIHAAHTRACTHALFAKRFKRFQTRTNGGDDRAAISSGEFHRSLNPREIKQRSFSRHLKVSLSPRRARSAR